MKPLTVELNTPGGRFLSTLASSVDLRTRDGSVHLTATGGSFMNLDKATEVTLRTPAGTLVFELVNAAAGLSEGTLSVLAERIEPVPSDDGESPPSGS
jgi:hypothetical protein